MKIKTLSYEHLPKWALYSIGTGLLVGVFAIGALAAPHIPSPFKSNSPEPTYQQVSEQDQMFGEQYSEQGAEKPKAVTAMINQVVKRAVTTSTAPIQNAKEEAVAGPSVGSVKTALHIENIKSTTKGNTAVVTWATTIPAKSRLIFDNGEGRVFESEGGLNTDHKIEATDLVESREYDYKITATSEDKSQYDDQYGILYALKKYTATLGGKENDCQIFIVKDTAGRIATGKTVRLSPSLIGDNGSIYTKGALELRTNSRGEIEYCERANTFSLIGDDLNITLSSR